MVSREMHFICSQISLQYSPHSSSHFHFRLFMLHVFIAILNRCVVVFVIAIIYDILIVIIIVFVIIIFLVTGIVIVVFHVFLRHVARHGKILPTSLSGASCRSHENSLAIISRINISLFLLSNIDILLKLLNH